MGAGLPEFDRLLVEFVGAAVGVGSDPLPHDLEAVLAVGVEVDDDGVPVGVVQGVHGLGGDVQQGVLFLRVDERDERQGRTPLKGGRCLPDQERLFHVRLEKRRESFNKASVRRRDRADSAAPARMDVRHKSAPKC